MSFLNNIIGNINNDPTNPNSPIFDPTLIESKKTENSKKDPGSVVLGSSGSVGSSNLSGTQLYTPSPTQSTDNDIDTGKKLRRMARFNRSHCVETDNLAKDSTAKKAKVRNQE